MSQWQGREAPRRKVWGVGGGDWQSTGECELLLQRGYRPSETCLCSISVGSRPSLVSYMVKSSAAVIARSPKAVFADSVGHRGEQRTRESK